MTATENNSDPMAPKPAKVGFELTGDTLAQANELLREHPAIDTHAHPGRTFGEGAENLSSTVEMFCAGGSFEPQAIDDMRAGGISGAVFNGVGDFQLLELGETGLSAPREFMEGEGWASYHRQIANLQALESRGLAKIALTPDDLIAQHVAGDLSAVLAMEGADFLEDDTAPLQMLWDDGVRMMTLMHYHDNALGDIMTEDGTRGLTGFGRDCVGVMNELGMIIDLTHASHQASFDVVATSNRPVMLSHVHVSQPGVDHPRFVPAELALAVAKGGGLIGAWPAGIGIDDLAGFVDRIVELIDLLGEDHVALGTDMDANYMPVLETYRKVPLMVGALLDRGQSPERITKFMGGNFLRVMAAVQG